MCVVHIAPESMGPREIDPYNVPDEKFVMFARNGVEIAKKMSAHECISEGDSDGQDDLL